jgi:hypothetical protein
MIVEEDIVMSLKPLAGKWKVFIAAKKLTAQL